MQTSARNRETGPSFAARKGHLPHLSISDDNHHVTEAIGHMYGDDDSPSSPGSNHRASLRSDRSSGEHHDATAGRGGMARKPIPVISQPNGNYAAREHNARARSPPKNNFGWENQNGLPGTPPVEPRQRAPSDTATAHFPLNDIDYESSPAAVAQELSNLQALRRMSMDVAATGDPDLPQLNPSVIPSAPSPDASEDDDARLFWVPARLHPELAPKEFKTFLESKAEQIKRRSGELSAFNSPTSSRSSSLSSSNSNAGLRRKKSMLSRQIDSSVGYQDGADRLERKKSRERANGVNGPSDPNLQELESLVSGGEDLQRLSLENKSEEESGDIILPSVPGSSLKRSTRTKYQRSDSMKGRGRPDTYAQRAARRAAAGGGGNETSPVKASPTINDGQSMPTFSADFADLDLSLNDPSSRSTGRGDTNFSRPGGRMPSPPVEDMNSPEPSAFDAVLSSAGSAGRPNTKNVSDVGYKRGQGQIASKTASQAPIPQIVEIPPPEDRPVRTSSKNPPPTAYVVPPQSRQQQQQTPSNQQSSTVRASLQEERPKQQAVSQRPGMPAKQTSSSGVTSRVSTRGSNLPPQNTPTQSLDQPSPLPGQDSNTSNLSFIPTLTVDKKQEQKKKEEKKSGWSWLLGKEESEKEKDKDKEKPKIRSSRPSQSHDNTRLDLLQTSIDGGSSVKSRESLVLDRESLKLDEERKKESQRKAAGSEKKEKESIFSSIFGGKKSKAEKEWQKKHQERLSPEPRHREMKPDIDYNWTRFSILEERAIYRMAHIKLANPRRALYSQVLLSNFMYSYLAKVQQMHPQMNLPTSAKQQRKQKEQQQQQQQPQSQPDEYAQYQRYQQLQTQQDQHSTGQEQILSQQHDQYASQQSYDSNSSTYDYDYNTGSTQQQRPSSRGSKQSMEDQSWNNSHHNQQGGRNGGGNNAVGGVGNQYYHQQNQPTQRQDPRYANDDDDDDDMW